MFFEKNKYYVFVKYYDADFNLFSNITFYNSHTNYKRSKISLLSVFIDFDEASDYIVDHYTDIFTNPETIEDYAICYFNNENELITLTDIKSKLDKGGNINE